MNTLFVNLQLQENSPGVLVKCNATPPRTSTISKRKWDIYLLSFRNMECVSNYIHYKLWDGITYPFQNLNRAAVEFVKLISTNILQDMQLIIHFGITVNTGW